MLIMADETPAAEPWTDKVTYLQFKNGAEVYRAENVDAYKTKGGAWVLRHGDIKVTMSATGDRMIDPDGKTFIIKSWKPLAQGSRRLLETVPLTETKK